MKDYEKSRHVKDLYYRVVTSEGVKCKFSLIPKGLYVLRINEDTNSCFFGRKILDNSTNFKLCMYYAMLSKEVISDNLNNDSNALVGVLRTDSHNSDEEIIGVIRDNTVAISNIADDSNEEEYIDILEVALNNRSKDSDEDDLKCAGVNNNDKSENLMINDE